MQIFIKRETSKVGSKMCELPAGGMSSSRPAASCGRWYGPPLRQRVIIYTFPRKKLLQNINNGIKYPSYAIINSERMNFRDLYISYDRQEAGAAW